MSFFFFVLQAHKYLNARSDEKRIEYFLDKLTPKPLVDGVPKSSLDGVPAVDFGNKNEDKGTFLSHISKQTNISPS